MKCYSVCLVAMMVGSAVLGSEPSFWNANGTGSYDHAPAVTSFDGTAGTGIRWKTRLPNWCNGGILVVGDRVFVMSEPTDGYAPWLHCIDAHTGGERWRRELDPTVTMPEAERDAARANATAAWTTRLRAETVAAQAHRFYLAHTDQFSKRGEPAAEIADEWNRWVEQLANLGCQVNGRSFFLGPSVHGSGGAIGLLSGRPNAEAWATSRAQAEREQRLQRDGLGWARWRESGTWIGIAFGTPCSDGQRVYVVTGQACVFAFALDGTPVWQRRILTPAWEELDATDRQRLGDAVGKGWKGGQLAQEYATSPILCTLDLDGERIVLLVNAGRMLRAFDVADGRQRWARPLAFPMKHSTGTPQVIKVAGEPVVVSVSGGVVKGAFPEAQGDALIRVRDGVVVGRLPAGAHHKDGGTGILPLGDGRALVPLEGRIFSESIRGSIDRLGVVDFAWDATGNSVTQTVVWEIPGKRLPIFIQPAVAAGTLYYADGQMNLANGETKRMPWADVHQGYHDSGLLVAGDLLLKWNRYGQENFKAPSFGPDFQASFHFFDRASGEARGMGRLPISPADGADALQRHREEHDKSFWRWLGAAPPVVAHRRLYVRSYDFLWCIGAAQP